MPVLTANPITPIEPEIVYERLAFRCSLTAVANESGVEAGTCSIHATTYRKVENELDVFGIAGQAEKGATITFGQNATDDTLISAMTAIVTGYAKQTGEIRLNFGWRPEKGDLVGMVHLTIGEYSKGVGNSNDTMTTDPEFAQAFGAIIAALSEWCAARGW